MGKGRLCRIAGAKTSPAMFPSTNTIYFAEELLYIRSLAHKITKLQHITTCTQAQTNPSCAHG